MKSKIRACYKIAVKINSPQITSWLYFIKLTVREQKVKLKCHCYKVYFCVCPTRGLSVSEKFIFFFLRYRLAEVRCITSDYSTSIREALP
jgi:hypothetical protein